MVPAPRVPDATEGVGVDDGADVTARARRATRLAEYQALRDERPDLFDNPAGAAFEIVTDLDAQDQIAEHTAARLRSANRPTEYGDIGVLYRDQYLILVRDAVRFRDGRHGGYVRQLRPHPAAGAAVLATLPDSRIVLVRHFRHATRQWHWELPRGFGEVDAAGADTAARELVEELGVPAEELIFLGGYRPDSGMTSGTDELYFARLARPPGALPADAAAEGIDQVRLATPDEFTKMIRDGELTDGYALAAYAYAVIRGLLPAPA